MDQDKYIRTSGTGSSWFEMVAGRSQERSRRDEHLAVLA